MVPVYPAQRRTLSDQNSAQLIKGVFRRDRIGERKVPAPTKIKIRDSPMPACIAMAEFGESETLGGEIRPWIRGRVRASRGFPEMAYAGSYLFRLITFRTSVVLSHLHFTFQYINFKIFNPYVLDVLRFAPYSYIFCNFGRNEEPRAPPVTIFSYFASHFRIIWTLVPG